MLDWIPQIACNWICHFPHTAWCLLCSSEYAHLIASICQSTLSYCTLHFCIQLCDEIYLCFCKCNIVWAFQYLNQWCYFRFPDKLYLSMSTVCEACSNRNFYCLRNFVVLYGELEVWCYVFRMACLITRTTEHEQTNNLGMEEGIYLQKEKNESRS